MINSTFFIVIALLIITIIFIILWYREDKKLSLYNDNLRYKKIKSNNKKEITITKNEIKQLKNFVSFVSKAPVSSDVCCCGDTMQKHASPYNCGHTPVDMWDHSLVRWLEDINPLLDKLDNSL